MSYLTISERLKTIAAFCPKGSRVADIGSDHALLVSYLLAEGIADYCIAGEVNEGPYQAAKRQLAGLTAAKDRSSVRKGDGLAVLEPNEVDVICIAGMGGQLITSILEAGKSKLAGVGRLILQPNVGEDVVRRWFTDNGWQLVDEEIIEEDGIIYEILVATPGDGLLPYQGKDRPLAELLEIGPFLWEQKSPVLKRKWEGQAEKWTKILSRIEKSDRSETQDKLTEVRQRLAFIKEVLSCL